MTLHFIHLGVITGIMTVVGALYKVLTVGYRAAKKVDDTFTYVDALRTNHLPHLQRAIEAIAKHLDIDLPDDAKTPHPPQPPQ